MSLLRSLGILKGLKQMKSSNRDFLIIKLQMVRLKLFIVEKHSWFLSRNG